MSPSGTKAAEAKIAEMSVVTPRSLRGIVLFTLAMLLLLYVAWMVREVLLLVYVSALFAVVLSPMLNLIRRIRLGKWSPGPGLSIFILAATLLGSVVVFALFVVPPIVSDLKQLIHDWPTHSAALVTRIQGLPLLGNFKPPSIDKYGEQIAENALGWFSDIAGILAHFATAVILTCYFILDGRRSMEWVVSLFPHNQHARLQTTLRRAEDRIRHWLVGQAALMAILGVSSCLVFGILKVRYFFALAVFAGSTNLVPVLGAVVSLALASLVALLDSWPKMVGVVIFYAIYFQVENAFLTPRIMKSTLDLPPLAVLISLLLGGEIAGVVGALVAIPTAGLVAVFIDEYIVQQPIAVETVETKEAEANGT